MVFLQNSFIRHMRLTFFLISVLLLIGCKDEEDPPLPVPRSLVAGQVEDSINYRPFEPPLVLNPEYDDQGLYGVAKDSLDLDGDGTFDMVFELNILEEDSLHLLEGEPNPYPNFQVFPKNSYAVGIEPVIFAIGLGSVSTADFVAPLVEGQSIDSLPDWHAAEAGGLVFWQETPASSMYPPGTWYDLDESRYLVFRSGGRYGWMHWDLSNRERPTLISTYAQVE